MVFWIFKFWWKIALDQNLIQLQAFDGLGQSGIINLTFGRWLRLHVSILLRILFDTKNNQFVKKFRILFALIKNFQSFSILRMNFNFWLNKKVQNLIYRLFWSSLSRSKFDFSPVDFRLKNCFVDLSIDFRFGISILIQDFIFDPKFDLEIRLSTRSSVWRSFSTHNSIFDNSFIDFCLGWRNFDFEFSHHETNPKFCFSQLIWLSRL